MSRNPHIWRLAADLSLAEVARRVGIGGANPARTYQRYETGEVTPPLAIVIAVEKLSRGAVTPRGFHRVRQAYLLKRKSTSAALGGASALA